MSRTYRNYGPYTEINWKKPFWKLKGDHKKTNWWDIKKPQEMKNSLHKKNRAIERKNLTIHKIFDGNDNHLSFCPYKKTINPWYYD